MGEKMIEKTTIFIFDVQNYLNSDSNDKLCCILNISDNLFIFQKITFGYTLPAINTNVWSFTHNLIWY